MLAIEKTVTTYSFILIDKAHAAKLVKWEKDDNASHSHHVSLSADFKLWADKLRGTYNVHSVSVDPLLIPDGEEELDYLCKRLQRFSGSDRTTPTSLRRWRFVFNDEADALMFKMKWL